MKSLRIISLFVVIAVFVSVTGCSSVRVVKEAGPTIHMTKKGRIYVGDEYTGLKKMVKTLKSKGIKKDDRITIEIPENTSKNALKAIGRELASNGYVHILFKHKVEPFAEVGPDPLIKHLYEK
jgi:biopolymer transport protein ExbD